MHSVQLCIPCASFMIVFFFRKKAYSKVGVNALLEEDAGGEGGLRSLLEEYEDTVPESRPS